MLGHERHAKLDAALRVLVDLAIGLDDVLEGNDRADDRNAVKPADGEKLPDGVGLPSVVPPRVVAVGLALGSGEDEGRAIEVGLAAEVETTPELVVPGDHGQRTAEGKAADRVVER